MLVARQACYKLVGGAEETRLVCQVYIGGFFLLPWLWLANVWLFWPELRHTRDVTVYSCKEGLLVSLVTYWDTGQPTSTLARSPYLT